MSEFTYPPKRRNQPVKRMGSRGFPDGLNTLPHPSTAKDTELTELLNAIYSQYGSISKRLGSTILGEASEGGTKILNMKSCYGVGTAKTNYLIRISDSGKPEYYNFTSMEWTLLSGTAPVAYVGSNPAFSNGVPTFDTTQFTNIVQVYGKIYFANPVNELVWFDGEAWFIQAALADPATKATVAKTGSGTGTRTYYYRYVEYNDAGGTLASPGFSGGDADGTGYKNSMPELDTSTYLTITLPAAPAGTTKRAIFRGDTAGNEFYLTDLAPNVTTFVDKGEITPNVLFGIPEDNTTQGYHFYLLEVYRDRLVGVTEEMGKSILVWSVGSDKITNFGISSGAGYDDYHNGDGEEINLIKSFAASNQEGLYAFKDSRTGLLEFTDDGGSIRDINASFGSISPFSAHLAGNNMRLWSKEGVVSLGNEANYGTILRYSVLSLRAESITKRVTPSNIPLVCSEAINHLSLFGISTSAIGTGNNNVLVYDERYNSWSLWTGLYPAVFCKHIDSTKKERLFYGSSKDAHVVEMFQGRTDYGTTGSNGTKVSLSMSTKQYDAGLPDQVKRFDRATIVFGDLVGSNTSVQVIYADKTGIHTVPAYAVSTETILSGFGNDEWGGQEIGSMTEEESGSSVNFRYIDLQQKEMYWVKFIVTNDGISDEVSVLGLFIYYVESSSPPPYTAKLSSYA